MIFFRFFFVKKMKSLEKYRKILKRKEKNLGVPVRVSSGLIYVPILIRPNFFKIRFKKRKYIT